MWTTFPGAGAVGRASDRKDTFLLSWSLEGRKGLARRWAEAAGGPRASWTRSRSAVHKLGRGHRELDRIFGVTLRYRLPSYTFLFLLHSPPIQRPLSWLPGCLAASFLAFAFPMGPLRSRQTISSLVGRVQSQTGIS